MRFSKVKMVYISEYCTCPKKRKKKKKKGDLPVLLGHHQRVVFWQVRQTEGASHLPQGEAGPDTAQAEHMVTGQADGVLSVSQADGTRLKLDPGIQAGAPVLKQRRWL